MIAGTVTTPGCFLDAPEMLKRQYLAFCLDTWASEATNTGTMPPKVMMLLAGNKRGEFPANFLKWYGSNKDRLGERFLSLFEGVLSEDNLARMRQFALSDEVPAGVNACLERTEGQIEEYRTPAPSWCGSGGKRIEDAPEKTDNAADVLDELRQEAGMLRRLITQVQEKYPLNLFTDEGLLPNYAFPETGVKLKSIIYGILAEEGEEQGQKISQAQEYLRGASTAIRELAPFNTFYAEARKVVIDQVETGGRSNSQVEEWRFCDVCSHMEPGRPGPGPGHLPQLRQPRLGRPGPEAEPAEADPGVGPLRPPAEPDLRRHRRAGTPPLPAQGLHRHPARELGRRPGRPGGLVRLRVPQAGHPAGDQLRATGRRRPDLHGGRRAGPRGRLHRLRRLRRGPAAPADRRPSGTASGATSTSRAGSRTGGRCSSTARWSPRRSGCCCPCPPSRPRPSWRPSRRAWNWACARSSRATPAT